jgi:hypothetical protein
VSTVNDDSTFEPADTVDGAGGNDTFTLRLIDEDNAGTASSAGREVTNVENLVIRTVHSDGNNGANQDDAVTVNAADFGALSSVDVAGLRSDGDPDTANTADGLLITDLSADTDLTISGSDSLHDVQFGFDNDGPGDTIAITLNGATVRDLQPDTDAAAGEVALTASGDASTVSELHLGDEARTNNGAFNAVSTGEVTTLTLDGDQDLTLSTVSGFNDSSNATQTVDASGLTGDLTVGLATTDTFVLTGGEGDDRVNHVLTGDLSDDFTSEAVETHVVTGMNGADRSVDLGGVTGATTVGLDENAGRTMTFTGAAAGASVLLEGDGVEDFDDPAADDTVSNIGAISVEVSGSDPATETSTVTINNDGQALGVRNTDGDQRVIDQEGITIDNVESVAVEVEDGAATIESIDGDEATSFTFTSENDLTVGANATDADATPDSGDEGLEDDPTNVTAVNAAGNDDALASIDASNVAGEFTAALPDNIGDTDNQDVEFIGGDGGVNLDIGDQSNDTENEISVETGSGDDLIVVSANAQDADDDSLVISTGDGDDTLDVQGNVGSQGDDSSIDLGGGSNTIDASNGGGDISGAELSGVDVIEIGGNNTLTVDASNIAGSESDLAIRSFGNDTVGFRVDGSDDLDMSAFSTTGVGANDELEAIAGSGANEVTANGDVAVNRYTVDGSGNADGDDLTDFDFTGAGANDLIEFNIDTAGLFSDAYDGTNFHFVDGTAGSQSATPGALGALSAIGTGVDFAFTTAGTVTTGNVATFVTGNVTGLSSNETHIGFGVTSNTNNLIVFSAVADGGGAVAATGDVSVLATIDISGSNGATLTNDDIFLS